MADAVALADNMRLADVRECAAAGFTSPLHASLYACEVSTPTFCRATFFNGKLACIWGITRDGDLASVWMLTTSLVDEYRVTFVKTVKAVIRDMLSIYTMLHNVVDARHVTAIALLQRLGARLGESIRHPETGMEFFPFLLSR